MQFEPALLLYPRKVVLSDGRIGSPGEIVLGKVTIRLKDVARADATQVS